MRKYLCVYSISYFIEKFSNIPESLWCVGGMDGAGRRDAYGHCGEIGNITTDEARALWALAFQANRSIILCNDGAPEYLIYGGTPRTRILNFLRSLGGSS